MIEELQKLPAPLTQKLEKLQKLILEMGSVVVGYSGGIDSTLLAKIATDLLGERCLSVLGESEAFPENEVKTALEIASQIGLNVITSRTHELKNPLFSINNADRCYHCKTELFGILRQTAEQNGIQWVCDGSNADDVGDYRPGMKAGAEQGVRSPLKEAEFTKSDIRAVARAMNLPNWDKPAYACLSSRFPYGSEINADLLAKVGRAELVLKNMGFRQFRVRHHDTVARIELTKNDFLKALELSETIVQQFRDIGYLYVTLDLEGYRTGKMNDTLNL